MRCRTLLPFATLVAASVGRLTAQSDPGAALWRVAAQTLAVPPALAQGGAAVLWNPAQPAAFTAAAAIEAIQGAQDVGASGVLVTARARAGGLGSLAALYGRMQIGDLVRTSSSPAPDPGALSYYTQVVGASWARAWGQVVLGLTVARHATRLDQDESGRWTLDAGTTLPVGRHVRLAGATHFVSRLETDDPAQDVYAGVDVLAWSGRPWREAPPTALHVRYGAAVAHGFAADHHLGAGCDFGTLVTMDFLIRYEGGYAAGGWQPAAALALRVEKYRVEVAANPGGGGLGPAIRVGFEARFR